MVGYPETGSSTQSVPFVLLLVREVGEQYSGTSEKVREFSGQSPSWH